MPKRLRSVAFAAHAAASAAACHSSVDCWVCCVGREGGSEGGLCVREGVSGVVQ